MVVHGQTVQRSYSFCTTPYTDRYPAITLKKITGGLVSTYLHAHAHEGMTLQALPPTGQFTLPPLTTPTRHLVFIAGGSGITPLFSLLKAALIQEKETTISLFYANRHEANIIYREALQTLAQDYPERLHVTHVLSQPSPSWKGYQGRLNPPLLRKLFHALPEAPATAYFLSAPTGLMDMAKETLAQLGVPLRHIHQEHFLPPTPHATAKPFTYELKVDYLGRSYTSHPSSQQTILEASLDAGLDLPYACMTGSCNTCRAKCTHGSVKMDEDEGLTEEEIKEGYILTCVARPTSRKVTIEVST